MFLLFPTKAGEQLKKAAQHSAQKNSAHNNSSEEREYLLPALRKQHVQIAEIIAARACELVKVIRAGKYGKLDV